MSNVSEKVVVDTASEVGSSEQMRSEKMRNTPIGKLIFNMSMPAIISMIVQALYNIVDSIFVSNIGRVDGVIYNGTALGADSFLAISIGFPIVMLVNAIALGVAIGANIYIARKLGEGNKEKADQAAKTAIFMVLVGWVIVSVIGLIFAEDIVRPFVNSKNSSDVDYVIKQASLYLTLYMIGSVGFFLEITLNRVLQATGNMIVPMTCQLTGALTNIALDALLILVFNMGVLGAIIATVTSQFAACAVVFVNLLTKKQDVNMSMKGFKPSMKYISRIVKMAVPAFSINALGSVIMLVLNDLLKNGNGLFVFNAYYKVQTFVFMAMFGLMQGSIPILGFNYGSNNKKRFLETIKIMSIATALIMAAGVAVFLIFPEGIMKIFADGNQSLVDDGAYAFRVLSLSFIPAGLGIVTINAFQSVNKAFYSLLHTLSRQLIIFMPAVFILFAVGDLKLVWYSFLIAELLSVIIFVPLAVKQVNKQFVYKQHQYEQGLLKSVG